ncbi:MAG: LptF/LptG family permease [Candidatus Cloacimonetes bacterium]|nr:LptF/LptG family permease [Candidatus Cloacimonadota bacterium]
MKIIDKYLFKSFSRLYLIILSSFAAIFLVIEFFEKWSRFLSEEPAFWDVVSYFALRIPYIVVLSSPVAILLAGLFLMQYMGKHNETVAIRSAGISIKRMSVPLFAFGFIVTILLFVFGDTVMPWAEDTRIYIEKVKIKKQQKTDIRVRSNIQYKDDKNRLYYIGFLDGYKNKIKDIDISVFNDENEIVKKIHAEHGLWSVDSTQSNAMILTFYRGYIREFDDNRLVSYIPFEDQYFEDITIQPMDLVKSTKKPDEMTVFELSDYVERLKRIGEKHQKELVELNLKLAYPFVNVIMILFCIPLASLSKRGKSRGIGFVVAIAICFIYISVVRFGQSLGYNELLSPVMAAWFANIIFGTIGLIGLFKTST